MVLAVSTTAAHPILVLTAAAALRSMAPILAPVQLVTMVTPVNTHANLVTLVTTAVNSASALVMALVTLPLVTATADVDIMGRTAN